MSKFFRIGLRSLAIIGGLLILLIVCINLPFAKKFLTRQVNGLFTKLELPISIHSIKTVRLKSVQVEGFSIVDPRGDTIIYAGKVKADYHLLALTKSKVKLGHAQITQANVKLLMNKETGKLTIAESFKGRQHKPPDPEKKKAKWEITAKNLDIEFVHFLMSDSLGGTHILQDAEDIRLKKFNLSLQNRELTANAIELIEGTGYITLAPPVSGRLSQKNPNGSPWNFGARNLDLKNIDFSFRQERDSLIMNLFLEQGVVATNKLDISQKIIDVEKISLSGLDVDIKTAQGSGKNPETTKKEKNSNFLWDIKSAKLNLESVAVETGTHGQGMDGLEMKLRDFQMNSDRVGLDLKKLSFHLSNGFSMDQMKAELKSDSKSTELSLALKTGNSVLNMETSANAGFFDLLDHPVEVPELSLDLHRSQISLKDIAAFNSRLMEIAAYPLLASEPASMDLQLSKKNSSIHLADLSLSHASNFRLSLQGNSENSFDTRNALGDLILEITDINLPWLKELLFVSGLETKLPDSAELELVASIADTFRSPDIVIQLNSQRGDIHMAGRLDLENQIYDLSSEFGHIHLGEILAKKNLGFFTGSAEISGSGFSMETSESRASLQIDTLVFKDYNYTKTRIDGLIRPGELEFELLAEDPSLNGNLDIYIAPGDSIFRARASGTLFAQLDRIHLVQDTLAVESYLRGDFSRSHENIETNMHLEGITLFTPHDSLGLQQFRATFHADSISTYLSSSTDFITLDLQVGRSMSEVLTMGLAFKDYLNTFIDPQQYDGLSRVSLLPEINASGEITHHDVLDLVIKDPEFYFSGLTMSLTHDSSENHIQYMVNGSDIKSKSVETGDLEVILTDSAGFLDLSVISDGTSFFSGPQHQIHLKSRFAERSSINEFTAFDARDSLTYNLEFSSRIDSQVMVVTAPSKIFIIDSDQWQLESHELFQMDLDTKTLLSEFNMLCDSSLLHFHGRENGGFQTYGVELKHFDISSLLPSGLVPGQSEGLLSGSLEYEQLDSTRKKISTDMELAEASFSDVEFSDISIKGLAVYSDSGNYKLDLTTRLDSSEIRVQGQDSDLEPRSVHLAFSNFLLSTIEPFTEEYVSNLGGSISGNLGMSNEVGMEHFDGHLAFHETRARVNTLNSSFRVPDQQIHFAQEKLLLENFRVLDSLNNELLIDGYLDFSDPRAITSNLNISSSKLQVMNREASREASLYGSIFVDSRIDVKGPLINPTINGKILLSRGTELFYQYQEDLSVSESAKVVDFISYEEEETQDIFVPMARSSSFNNSSIETIVEIVPSTVLNFHLSKRIFDIELKIKGGGQLDYAMRNKDQISLAGNYTIGEGSADLKLVGWPNKSFEMPDGGSIRWDGDLENPELNIKAIHKVSSSYQNPVDGKQRTADFNVILQLSEHLQDLEVLFTIHTPDQYLMSIINTLSPEEQMRQAITILLFNTVDLPGISTSSDYMTQQVSQILATQLNSLTSSAIKGVDISFGLDSYEQVTSSGATETTTSLSYEVSKTFMNERAQIEVSGRLTDTNEKPGASDMSYNNILFEYRLDSAATRYLKVYNEHSYEDVFEGEVVRTGVGISYRKRYQRIRDIWKRKEKKKKAKDRGK